MPYLIQPPAHSVDACNPLFTYTFVDPTPSELSKLKNLQNWGWNVSVHFHNDEEYLDAIEGTEKAIKKRRRRTQMIYGDMMGDGPRLTFEEVWERETKKLSQELSERKEEEVNDQASIMSQMTQQRLWVRWVDKEAGLEAEKSNVSQAVDKRSYPRPISKSEDGKNGGEYMYQGPAGSPITRRNTNSTSQFIEEDETNWQAIVSPHSFQQADPQPASQEVSQSSTSSTSTASSEDLGLLLDSYMLAMATCGHGCSPAFLQTWSRQNSRSQSAALRTELPSEDPKEPRKLRKQIARRNSEPSIRYWLPPRFVRPLCWVKRKRSERAGRNANLIAPEQQQIEDSGYAERSSSSISQHRMSQSLPLSPYTILSDSLSDTLQSTTSTTTSDSSLHLHQNISTSLQPESRGISPTFSTTSSLVFPGRDITQEEYFRRTNRPRENLQPRQLKPPPGLEAENDPYKWQAWDRGRARQESKTHCSLGKDSMRRPRTGKTDKERNRSSWYDDFRKKMKEEQIQAQKEQKEADKEKKKETKRLERQERKRKEEAAREALRKQGMFSGGYLARYA